MGGIASPSTAKTVEVCKIAVAGRLTGQRLSYSVGFTLPDTIAKELATIPEADWQIAYDADGEPRVE